MILIKSYLNEQFELIIQDYQMFGIQLAVDTLHIQFIIKLPLYYFPPYSYPLPMLNLGKQVLKKIENLLVEVDKKRPNAFTFKEPSNIPKSNSKSKSKSISISKQKQKQIPLPQTYPLPQTHKNHKPNHHRNPTTNQADKQNIASHRFQQLYLNHFIKEKRLLDRNLINMQQQMRTFRNFKVQNKTSHYLNHKQQLKPIYQRTPEILKHKSKSIDKIKESHPAKVIATEEEQEQAILEEVRKRHPKLSRQEFQKRMEQMEQRNLLRMEKTQKKRLKQMTEKSLMFTEKPEVHLSNKVWWEKKKLKKNLSTNLLQRFSQYDAEKKEKWDRYLERRKQEETPFAPKLSQNTKQIARKSMSRRSLMQNLPRSLSCRALSKREESTVSFIQRIQREQKTERKNNESIDRSLSRQITHGKSVATMSSSRNALLERRFN